MNTGLNVDSESILADISKERLYLSKATSNQNVVKHLV